MARAKIKGKEPLGVAPSAPPATKDTDRGRARSPDSSTNSDEPVVHRPRTDVGSALVVAAQPCERPSANDSILIQHLQRENQQQRQLIQDLHARIQRLEEENVRGAPPPSPPPSPVPQPSFDSTTMIALFQQLITAILPLIQHQAPAAPSASPSAPLPQQQQPSSPSSYATAVSSGASRPPPSASAPQPAVPPKGRSGWMRGATQRASQQLYETQFVMDAPADAEVLTIVLPEDMDGPHGPWHTCHAVLKELLPECDGLVNVDPSASFLRRPPTHPVDGPAPAAGRGDRVRILFSVMDKDDAKALVKERHRLKGTGITIYDVLSPTEQERHDALWPSFLEARRKGKKAQFNRAQLRVDGERVEP